MARERKAKTTKARKPYKSKAKVPGRGRGNPYLIELKERREQLRIEAILRQQAKIVDVLPASPDDLTRSPLSPISSSSQTDSDDAKRIMVNVNDIVVPRKQGVRMSDEETAAAKSAFILAFQETGIILDGINAAGVSYSTYDRWMENDEVFVKARNEAWNRSNDVIRREIYRRAVEGNLEPVYYQGERVDVKRTYSDLLLMFHGKARMPDEYRDKVDVHHSGTLTVLDIVRMAAGEALPSPPEEGAKGEDRISD